MHITSFGEKNVRLDYCFGCEHGRMFSCSIIVYCMVLLVEVPTVVSRFGMRT